ncbi:hypothetical protein [Micromonospora coerulea]|uniref:hypothetical protein n=1 Tax=Micromonospora coerulea TaxID=47856 RepID=UPI0019039A91|nr:hypothetical protein [Micromonospora veneta]
MTAPTVSATGVQAFVAALEEFGAEPVVIATLVTYTVTPVTGALAGRPVRTGVSVDEVAPWPTTPPHWIHLPADVTLAATNAGGSPMAGWVAHSRDIPAWGTAQVPVAAWLAHVRGVLGGAV